MRKYYTRACNFYHGRAAASLIKSNKAFPLNGKKDIAFDKIEIFIREKNKVNSKIILCKDIKKLNKNSTLEYVQYWFEIYFSFWWSSASKTKFLKDQQTLLILKNRPKSEHKDI